MNPLDILRNPWRLMRRVGRELSPSSTRVPALIIDVQGDIQDYHPRFPDRLPSALEFNGHSGELGHYSIGYLHISDSDAREYSIAGIRLRLDEASFHQDRGVTRMALATAWKPMRPDAKVDHYYVEFDLWSSPRWNRVVRLVRYNCYDPHGRAALRMPTIELKLHQLRIGETAELTIPIRQMFHDVFPEAEAVLDAVYLVLNKQDRSSDFVLKAQLMELTLD